MSFISIRGTRAAIRGAMCAALLLVPGLAQAEWTRAESTNFIVYSEGPPEDLRSRVVDLEKFGGVLQAMTGARRLKDVPVKITVYFVRTVEDVGNTLPFPSGGVGGYYNTTMRGPFTVMPRMNLRAPRGTRYRTPDFNAKQVLQHELTHHFMYQYFPGAYPFWYSEGFAEYAGALEIDEDDLVKVGLFLPNRAQALRSNPWVPLKHLLNPDPRRPPEERLAGYSQGWILVHYLNKDMEGKKKLLAYLKAILDGATFEHAAKELGDTEVLDRELRAYAKRSTLDATATKYLNLDPGPITLTKLSPAQEELLRAQLTLSSGVPVEKTQGFARQVRDIASRYPNDPYAMRIWADAERLAGNTAAALAIADKWLAASPSDPWANYFRGDIDAAALAAAKSTDEAAWKAARTRIQTAMRASPNEPRFARAYYESYSRTGKLPPPAAQNALAHALDLIPRERSLRYMVAADYERRGMIEDAISTIGVDAYGVADETDSQKRRRERMQKQYAIAEDDDTETPREMLVRLLGKRDAAAQSAAKQ